MYYRRTLNFCEENSSTSYLCNSYLAPITDKGKCFASVDHYLAYHKAMLAGDKRLADIMLMTESVDLVKSFGRNIINHDESKWERIHFKTLRRAIYLKFIQNPDLMRKFSLTRGKRLVYANVKDSFYGNGTSPESFIMDAEDNEGFNILGYVLMDVRNDLFDE
ncbi:riboflavin biosynthesis protein VVA0006-like [Brevipalpus obovatus]|uniref:riboflavin biosynthesis protein VVA0006-like n=1 Tax=Brevipalpus obovatus TaxID=246614 RepID=UPI003D9F5AA0